ncbi:MAG TPA: XdhC/CoxI family protein [Dehalococcoidia bacterium]|nr:XdhC/CoxI family protein [Dehalococcoidia bacterium]
MEEGRRKEEEGGSRAILREIARALESGEAVLVATVVAGFEGGVAPGTKMLVRPDGSTLGGLDGGTLEAAVKTEAPDAFRRHGVETLYLAPDATRLSRQEAAQRPSYQVMLEVHESAARLLIIGGGHIGKALAVIGNLCGFSVEVVDDRVEYANEGRFPEADRVTQGRFDEVLQDYPIDANTYIVCVTRGHRHDEMSLRLVVDSPAAYVGMIGSKRRVGAVLKHLEEDGAAPEHVARVRTPIGLDIGAETPEEIAVAIMAEIIMERRGGSGTPMKRAGKKRHGIAPEERVEEE